MPGQITSELGELTVRPRGTHSRDAVVELLQGEASLTQRPAQTFGDRIPIRI
jgi:hypothetical protein